LRALPHTKKHPCGGYGYAVGLPGQSVRVPLDCNRWDCEKCGKLLTQKWMEEINEDLRGSVLYTVSTKKQGEKLSGKIRCCIKMANIYFCARSIEGAIVFSNAKFEDSIPKNRKKFKEEIRRLMESGTVKGMSRRRKKKAGHTSPNSAHWSFARITDDIKSEYDKCKTDLDIGKLLLKYRGTDKIRSLTKLGKELLWKINTGEINEFNG
jgi:hypothetical protein